MAISTNGTVLARVAGALYNTQMSNATYSEVKALDPATLVNTLYARDFASATDLSVAATLVTNLGLTSVTGLTNWVSAQLTAAGTANKGAKIVDLLNGFAQMTADAIYGTAAIAFNTKVDAALALSQTTDNKGGTFEAAGVAITNATFTLTTGLDTPSGHGTFNAADIAGVATWTAGDTISGSGTGNVLNLITGAALVNPAGTTVSGIQTANVISGTTVGAASALDTSNWTGLTALNVTTPSTASVKAAATTAVSVTDSAQGASTITLVGGSTNTVTAASTGTGNIIIGGVAASAPTGAVIVNQTANGTGTLAGGSVGVTGGTSITVNETLTQATTGTTTTAGTITVTGNALTTAVTVVEPTAVSSSAGVTTASVVTFATNGTLAAGQSVTVAGLTFTVSAGNTASAAQLAAAFANIAAGAATGASVGVGAGLGSYSGTFTGFATGAVTGNTVTATAAATLAVVAAPAVSTSSANFLPFVTTQTASVGKAPTAGIAGGAVNIADLNAGSGTIAGTITTVSLTGIGAASTVSSNALNNLTIAKSASLVTSTEGLVAPTNTTLALNLDTATGGFTDASNQFKIINANVTGTTSTGTAATSSGTITDTALTTLNVTGTGNYTNAALNTNAALTTVTSATSGTTTLTLGTGQAFTGSGAGKNAIILAASDSAVISLSSNATNTVAVGFTGTQSFANITGYSTVIASVAASSVAMTNVASGTPLSIPVSTGSVSYASVDSLAASDSVSVTISPAASTTAVNSALTQTALILTDKLGSGIGNVSIASSYNLPSLTTTITALDTGITVAGISQLTLSGNAAYAIGGTTAWTNTASAVTITNNSTSSQAHSFGLTDNALSALTINGTTTGATTVSITDTLAGVLTIANNATAAVTISNLNGGAVAAATSMVITDTSSAPMTVSAFTDNALTSFSLSNTGGNLATVTGVTGSALTSVTLSSGVAATITSTAATAVTIAASSDNAALTINTGAGADAITVGGGTNSISAGLGADAVTFAAHATGAVTIRLNANATATMSTTLGLDSGYFGTAPVLAGAANTAPTILAANTTSTATFDVYTGVVAGDKIQLLNTTGFYTGAAGAPLGLIANGVALTDLTAAGLNTVALTTTGATDNAIEIVKGTYTASTNTFVGSSTGTSSLLIYDANATGGAVVTEAIVLVGYVAASVTGIGGAAGLITLA